MKNLQGYLALPYTKTVRWDERDSIFVARVKELPGCAAHGDTEAAALEMLQDNMEDWIADCLDSGDSVPMPEEQLALPSGKWVQRVPRSLHRQLVEKAADEGVSLNQLVVSYLASAVERPSEKRAQPEQASLMSLESSPNVIKALKGATGSLHVHIYQTSSPTVIRSAQPNQALCGAMYEYFDGIPGDRPIVIGPKGGSAHGYKTEESKVVH